MARLVDIVVVVVTEFGVFSSDALFSLFSPFVEDFGIDVSVSAEGVLGFSNMPEDVVEDFKSSVV